MPRTTVPVVVSDVCRSACGSETRSIMGALRLVLARTLVTGKIAAYLNFLLAKRDFGDDLETRNLIRLRIF